MSGLTCEGVVVHEGGEPGWGTRCPLRGEEFAIWLPERSLTPPQDRPPMSLPPRQDLLFVGIQFALLFALAVDPLGVGVDLPAIVRCLGWGLCGAAVVVGVLALLQLGTNLTPWPSPRRGSQLVTTGLYAWVRHPIYTSLALFAFALVLATGSAWRLGLALALLALFWRKATYEEGMLRERYPEYAEYARRVGFGS